jgi:5,10-methylenetetrahydromethanopterin reductase
MDFAIALPTPADSWKLVKRAEDSGFSTAWFYDTPVLSADVFVAIGAAAVKTERIFREDRRRCSYFVANPTRCF